MVRRRKRRSWANPLGWIPPEAWPIIGRIAGIGAIGAAPALAVRQESVVKQDAAEARADTASMRLGYANENTNAALAALAIITFRLDSLTVRVRALERLQRIKSPDYEVGPEVPAGWFPQPVKKKRFLGLF